MEDGKNYHSNILLLEKFEFNKHEASLRLTVFLKDPIVQQYCTDDRRCSMLSTTVDQTVIKIKLRVSHLLRGFSQIKIAKK